GNGLPIHRLCRGGGDRRAGAAAIERNGDTRASGVGDSEVEPTIAIEVRDRQTEGVRAGRNRRLIRIEIAVSKSQKERSPSTSQVDRHDVEPAIAVEIPQLHVGWSVPDHN